jgi:hypothetical protein
MARDILELWPLLIVVFVVYLVFTRRKRRSGTVGPGAAGAMYELLSEDRRKAVEIIVEQGAEKRRPEYPDGNLPELDDPKPKQKSNP